MPAKPFAEYYEELKQLIHKELVTRLDPASVSRLTGDAFRGEVRVMIERLIDGKKLLLNRLERERLINDVLKMVPSLARQDSR